MHSLPSPASRRTAQIAFACPKVLLGQFPQDSAVRDPFKGSCTQALWGMQTWGAQSGVAWFTRRSLSCRSPPRGVPRPSQALLDVAAVWAVLRRCSSRGRRTWHWSRGCQLPSGAYDCTHRPAVPPVLQLPRRPGCPAGCTYKPHLQKNRFGKI